MRELRIEFDSQMRSLSIATLFPNLERVDVEGRRIEHLDELQSVPKLKHLSVDTKLASRSLAIIPSLRLAALSIRIASKKKDVEMLSKCRFLPSLSVSSWPESDLRALSKLDLTSLYVSSGPLKKLSGIPASSKMTEVRLCLCTKLTDIADANIPYVQITACNRVDLSSLSGCSQIEFLDISEQRELNSIAFVDTLPSLQELSVVATTIKVQDFEPLVRSKSLRHVWLCAVGTASDATIAAISARNAKVKISNGNVFLCNGKPISNEEFFKDSYRNRHLPR